MQNGIWVLIKQSPAGGMFLNSSLAHVINTRASTCSKHTCQHVQYTHVLARVLYTCASTCSIYTCQHLCFLHMLRYGNQEFEIQMTTILRFFRKIAMFLIIHELKQILTKKKYFLALCRTFWLSEDEHFKQKQTLQRNQECNEGKCIKYAFLSPFIINQNVF